MKRASGPVPEITNPADITLASDHTLYKKILVSFTQLQFYVFSVIILQVMFLKHMMQVCRLSPCFVSNLLSRYSGIFVPADKSQD